jgi:hypothetical protein
VASKVQKAQHLTIALCQGLTDMLWEQRYMHQEKNKNFSHARERVNSAVIDIRKLLIKENGQIHNGDIKKIKEIINIIKTEYLIDGIGFTPMMGVSIMVDMVVYQISVTNGEKNKLFNTLLTRINYLTRYFDPKGMWEDPDETCLKATEHMRKLMGV